MAKHVLGLSLLAAGLAVVALPVVDAEAGFRRLRSQYNDGEVITAYSRYSDRAVRGVVRHDPLGWQVRLPQGRWVFCRRSCEETLRVETIDRDNNPDANLTGGGTFLSECGIFGCLDFRARF